MLISVTVKPHAGSDKVIEENHEYLVFTRAVPSGGAANEAVVLLLAEHFKISKSRIRIKSGRTSRRKIVEVDE